MNVKISEDFTQVVFTHHAENYMLTESHKPLKAQDDSDDQTEK